MSTALEHGLSSLQDEPQGWNAIIRPALVVRGSRGDVSSAATASALLAALPRATVATFDASGPLPFVDEDERFREAALSLFDAADGVATRRAVMGGKGGVEVMS